MDKVRSKYKETRCTCITDLVKGQNKKQHRPTGAGALSRSSLSLKSVVVIVENREQCKSRCFPRGPKANATGHTRLEFKVKKRHHVASSRAKAHRVAETKIKIEIKSRSRPTKVELRFKNSVAARKARGDNSVAARKARGDKVETKKSRYSLEADSFDAQGARIDSIRIRKPVLLPP